MGGGGWLGGGLVTDILFLCMFIKQPVTVLNSSILMMATKAASRYATHFDIPKDTTGKYKAKCKYCCMMVSSAGTTTSNLLLHLKVRCLHRVVTLSLTGY